MTLKENKKKIHKDHEYVKQMHGYPSNSCQYMSLLATNVNLMVAPQEKLEDQQHDWYSSSWDHECP